MNCQMDSQFEEGGEFPFVLIFDVLHFRIKFVVLDNLKTEQIHSQESLFEFFSWTNLCP